jgi:hypothetical protein
VVLLIIIACTTGFNVTTETYSVFQAEARNHSDPSTGLNKKLLHDLNSPNTEVTCSTVFLRCCGHRANVL